MTESIQASTTSENQSPPRKPRARFVRALERPLAAVGLAWLLVATADVVMMLARLGTHSAAAARPADWGPRWNMQRLDLICFELITAAACVLLIALGMAVAALAAGALARLLAPPLLRRRAVRIAATAAALLLAWAGCLGFAASWATLWTQGSFVDRQSIFFFFALQHPLTSLQLANSQAVYLLPVLLLLLVLSACLGGSCLLRRMRPADHRAVALTSGLLLAAATIIALRPLIQAGRPAPPAASDELLAVDQPSVQRMWEVRRYQCGPCATAMLDATRLDQTVGDLLRPDPTIPVAYRPIIPMSQYLQSVDPSRVHRWNMVFIEVESMRPDALHLLGARRPIMPTLDALASQSLLFNHAYTQAVHSNYAVGCPLSGQYPMRSDQQYVYPPNLPYPHVMIYDVLKALGYRVGLFSSANDHWFGLNNFLDTPSVDHAQDSESFQGSTHLFAADAGFTSWAQMFRRPGLVDDADTVRTAIQWIDQQRNAQPLVPFFTFLYFQASHFPYLIPPSAPHRYGPVNVNFAESFGNYPPEKTALIRGMYDDSLGYVDHQIARLVEHLQQTHQWENTLLVLTGDHGQAFYEHGFVTHGNSLYEELTRVPILIHPPADAHLSPRVEPYPTQHIDLPPTLLALMGLPTHPAFAGINVLDINHRPASHRLFTMGQTPLMNAVAIVKDDWKLINDLTSHGYLLFDIAADPQERHNLLRSEPKRAKRLADQLNTWRALQLNYYRSPLHEAQIYPPVMLDP